MTRRFVLELRHLRRLLLATIVFSASMLGAITMLHLQGRKPTVMENGFSVRWMGFVPDYSDAYPDYYICVNDLKDDILRMKIALQIKNQEESGYYFLVNQYSTPPVGWFVGSLRVGYVDVDQTRKFTYSNITRLRPTSIVGGTITENVQLVVQAYSDSAYSVLYSQDNFNVTYHFIDRQSPVWTTLYADNFDDETTHGWSCQVGRGDQTSGYFENGEVTPSTTYYRSFRYSLELQAGTWNYFGPRFYIRSAFTKAFNTSGPYLEAYLIFSVRSEKWRYNDQLKIDWGGSSAYFMCDVNPSTNTWYQFAVPMPANTSRVYARIWCVDDHSYPSPRYHAYLDDVYVIAK